MGAGVLQLSVVLDKGIAMALMQVHETGPSGVQIVSSKFSVFGRTFRLPMEEGAPTRLDRAQTLYQFPLGVFAIALATAIFPSLSADALNQDRKKFRDALRHGIEASLWEGLPASVGLMLVALPLARLLFQHGQNTPHDAVLIARSTAVYAAAIWAFSLLQIINRAYYAVQDMLTPLKMAAVNIVINLVVEIPLLWWLGESGMAVGTVVSFVVQALMMLWMLDRRIGGLELRKIWMPVLKMIFATLIMGAVCFAVKNSPLYPHGAGRIIWAVQLVMLLTLGAGIYLGLCAAFGITLIKEMLPRRR
jgi:putative peptidoglycan lipid II flippase